MSLPLTEKQERLWRYIKACERSPTYSEMASALGYPNNGNLNRTIVVLKEKGFVTYIPNRARSLIALDPKDDLSGYRTTSLIAELERRGVVLAVPA